MADAGVPTADCRVCHSEADRRGVDDFGAPYVVKHDGLAAGKGVLSPIDRDAALEHGMGSEQVEEHRRPRGQPLRDHRRTHALPLQPAQDFKRVGDGDRCGPNTVWCSCSSPPWLPAGTVDEVMTLRVTSSLARTGELGDLFSGLLYVGLADQQGAARRRVQRLAW